MRRAILAIISTVYVFSLAVMAITALRFEALSQGLAARTPDGPFYCHELQSSGSDDDAMIGAFALFIVPLAYRLLRVAERPSKGELAVYGACAALSLIALFLAGLDCAEVFYTAFGIPDPALSRVLISFPVSALAITLLRRGGISSSA